MGAENKLEFTDAGSIKKTAAALSGCIYFVQVVYWKKQREEEK